jgi:hypothetical protein
MKIVKIIIYVILAAVVVFYVYYSTLSMKIYKKIDYYKSVQNKTAEEFSKRIILEKYPGSLAYFILLTKK